MPFLAWSGPATLSDAARTFLAALSDDERDDARWPFDDDERSDIRYAPLMLDGLRHGDLDARAYALGDAVLEAALSADGYRKVSDVRLLERDVAAAESRLMRSFRLRDPGRYFWAFFGEPDDVTPWGFRYEGHHLSINITHVPGAAPSSTPLFIGAQPRVVPDGMPSAGVAALGKEEALARELYAALDAAQRRAATLPYADDRGHMIGQVARLSAPAPVGVARTAMNTAQRAMLDALVATFVEFWDEPIRSARRAEADAALEALHFAFASSETPRHAFYARVSGPGLLIEIDNTEGGDHVHAVWHRPGGDFGDDLLARHWQEVHGVRLTADTRLQGTRVDPGD